MFLIRKAIPDDALGITIVNVYTWKITYTGLIPDELIDKRIDSLKYLAKEIREDIEKNNNFIVASIENTIIGFCSYGNSRNESFMDSGEINALYVLHGFQGEGLGKELFLAGAKELKHLGYSSVIINCLQGNPSIEFYKHMGGNVVSERKDKIKGTVITEDIIYIKI
ncbi:GNAT family N-acetyltransferase [Clostridium sardiniense]|uniref:GNAT family N-acetyltransferase n=1 Tax=Clostridium sardiniense TaxID=29369 RepID=UPI00195E15A7|nr:GNAT family N-acetyltransferase [Clostridium sardiniense]MBM7834635.1 ribosomal protein S18 acetylase RimI-like enzyme [Clostridium sardiniense]